MMTMLTWIGRRVHRYEYFRSKRSNVTNQTLERLFLAPFLKGGRDAFGISPIKLIKEEAVPHTQSIEAFPQFRFSQCAEGRAGLSTNHISSSFSMGAINVCNDGMSAKSVLG